jgi:hypothetical protein
MFFDGDMDPGLKLAFSAVVGRRCRRTTASRYWYDDCYDCRLRMTLMKPLYPAGLTTTMVTEGIYERPGPARYYSWLHVVREGSNIVFRSLFLAVLYYTETAAWSQEKIG